MKIEKLDLPETAIEFLKSQGFEKLYPPQADSVESGLLDGKSILVSAPTASGKTLIAMLAIISYLSKNDGKVIYLSPLRALAYHCTCFKHHDSSFVFNYSSCKSCSS